MLRAFEKKNNPKFELKSPSSDFLARQVKEIRSFIMWNLKMVAYMANFKSGNVAAVGTSSSFCHKISSVNIKLQYFKHLYM